MKDGYSICSERCKKQRGRVVEGESKFVGAVGEFCGEEVSSYGRTRRVKNLFTYEGDGRIIVFREAEAGKQWMFREGPKVQL